MERRKGLHKLTPYDFRPLYEAQPVYPVSGWTPEDIMCAIDNMDMGQFSQAERLYHAMTKQSRIGSALEQRVHNIRIFPNSIEFPHDTPEKIKKAGLLFEQNFSAVFPNHAMSEILRRTIMFGFCIARHVFKPIDNQIIPTIQPWTHSNCDYDANERRFYVATEQGERIPVEGDPWIIFSLGGDRPWLNGAMRKLAYPFSNICLALDRWNNFNDTEAAAIKKVTSTSYVREQTEAGALVQKSEVMRSGDTIYVPEGYDFELVTSGGRGSAYKAFQDMIELELNEISIILLGNNLTQSIKSGSLAAANAAAQGALRISQADVEFLGEPVNLHTCRLWIQKNFTPIFYGHISLVPYRPRWSFDVDAALDKQTDAGTALQFANATTSFLNTAMTAGVASQLNINWEETAKRCGIVLYTNRLPEVTKNES